MKWLAINAAFSHILRLRLDQQMADLAAGRGDSHRPETIRICMNIDRAILRESLKQARRLQHCVSS
jgi:CBS domain-containing protein